MNKTFFYVSAALVLGASGCSKGYDSILNKLNIMDSTYCARFDRVDTNYAILSKQIKTVGDTCNRNLKKSREINERTIKIRETIEDQIQDRAEILVNQKKLMTSTDSLVSRYKSLQAAIIRYGDQGLIDQDSLKDATKAILEGQKKKTEKPRWYFGTPLFGWIR